MLSKFAADKWICLEIRHRHFVWKLLPDTAFVGNFENFPLQLISLRYAPDGHHNNILSGPYDVADADEKGVVRVVIAAGSVDDSRQTTTSCSITHNCFGKLNDIMISIEYKPIIASYNMMMCV